MATKPSFCAVHLNKLTEYDQPSISDAQYDSNGKRLYLWFGYDRIKYIYIISVDDQMKTNPLEAW